MYTKLIIPVLILIAGCSPVNKRYELPSEVSIKQLDFETGKIQLLVSNRQQLTTTDNLIACQLAVKDGKSIEFETGQIPTLTAYAVESIILNMSEPKADGDWKNSFSYILDCHLSAKEMAKQRIINRSVLYKIPGTTKQYR